MRIQTGWESVIRGELPVRVRWKCSACGKDNETIDTIKYEGRARGGTNANRTELNDKAVKNGLVDAQKKLKDLNKGNWANAGLEKCSCSGCSQREPWTAGMELVMLPRVLNSLIFLVGIFATFVLIKYEAMMLIYVPALTVLLLLMPAIIYYIKATVLLIKIKKLPKESIPVVTIVRGSDSGRPGTETAQNSAATLQEGWRCAFCNKMNPDFMGFCSCGKSRGETKKREAERSVG
ncbi:MAG: hypothetical protein IKI75_03790 [Lachnospiraceae bacterium]|nr:hypothetical protein [Lachnospiraceae bacterium]